MSKSVKNISNVCFGNFGKTEWGLLHVSDLRKLSRLISLLYFLQCLVRKSVKMSIQLRFIVSEYHTNFKEILRYFEKVFPLCSTTFSSVWLVWKISLLWTTNLKNISFVDEKSEKYFFMDEKSEKYPFSGRLFTDSLLKWSFSFTVLTTAMLLRFVTFCSQPFWKYWYFRPQSKGVAQHLHCELGLVLSTAHILGVSKLQKLSDHPRLISVKALYLKYPKIFKFSRNFLFSDVENNLFTVNCDREVRVTDPLSAVQPFPFCHLQKLHIFQSHS